MTIESFRTSRVSEVNKCKQAIFE